MFLAIFFAVISLDYHNISLVPNTNKFFAVNQIIVASIVLVNSHIHNIIVRVGLLYSNLSSNIDKLSRQLYNDSVNLEAV